MKVKGERSLTCTEAEQSWRLACSVGGRNEMEPTGDVTCLCENRKRRVTGMVLAEGYLRQLCGKNFPGDQHPGASSAPQPTPKTLGPTASQCINRQTNRQIDRWLLYKVAE